jgi:hypothetical protein
MINHGDSFSGDATAPATSGAFLGEGTAGASAAYDQKGASITSVQIAGNIHLVRLLQPLLLWKDIPVI